MGQDRLTRQEIGWLLAQEARGAASALRSDILRSSMNPALVDSTGPLILEATEPSLPSVESNLDALSDAVNLFAALQSGPEPVRRGRIDLAALLYAIAPGARIAIAPGAGTEVFGVEGELRRMLHVLVNHSTTSFSSKDSPATEVSIQRQGDWIRISVELGPDTSPTAELERRWLSRMTLRHGGKTELEGGTVSILLPADGASDQSELAELRRELEQAQQLGETYAKELAEVLASHDSDLPLASNSQSGVPQPTDFGFAVHFSSEMGRSLRRLLEPLRLELEALKPSGVDTSRAEHALASLSWFVAELVKSAHTPEAEPPTDIDFSEATRLELDTLAERANRLGVRLEMDLPPRVLGRSRRQAFQLLVQKLVSHALDATPPQGVVHVTLVEAENTLRVEVEDEGTTVPLPLREGLVTGKIDASSVGRPGRASLLLASAAAGVLGGTVTLGESSRKNTLVLALLPLYQLT